MARRNGRFRQQEDTAAQPLVTAVVEPSVTTAAESTHSANTSPLLTREQIQSKVLLDCLVL